MGPIARLTIDLHRGFPAFRPVLGDFEVERDENADPSISYLDTNVSGYSVSVS